VKPVTPKYTVAAAILDIPEVVERMAQTRVEIRGRNQYWLNAIFVEWEYQYPTRKLVPQSGSYYLIEADWLPDLQRVARHCFGSAVLAPDDPGRRQLFRRLFAGTKAAGD
jgi:hypothetical protein